MDQALQYLNELVADGVKYPDAEYSASFKYKIVAEELRPTYDAQFETPDLYCRGR